MLDHAEQVQAEDAVKKIAKPDVRREEAGVHGLLHRRVERLDVGEAREVHEAEKHDRMRRRLLEGRIVNVAGQRQRQHERVERPVGRMRGSAFPGRVALRHRRRLSRPAPQQAQHDQAEHREADRLVKVDQRPGRRIVAPALCDEPGDDGDEDKSGDEPMQHDRRPVVALHRVPSRELHGVPLLATVVCTRAGAGPIYHAFGRQAPFRREHAPFTWASSASAYAPGPRPPDAAVSPHTRPASSNPEGKFP